MIRLFGKLRAFALAHPIELAIVLLGIALRLTMTLTFEVRHGYDYEDHKRLIEWVSKNWRLAPVEDFRESFHPPLFYFVSALLRRLGVSWQRLNLVSIACGSIRLIAFWIGLRAQLPAHHIARGIALFLAAVLPASVHVDGTVNGEAMNDLFASLVILFVVLGLSKEGKERRRYAIAAGIASGIGVWAKVSGMATIGAAGLAAVYELARRTDGGKEARIQRFVPWLAAFAIAMVLIAPYVGRNLIQYGKPFFTSLDGTDGIILIDRPIPPSLLDRRPAKFYFGWNHSAIERPYYPAGTGYMWPVLIASTYADYYNYFYAPPAEPGMKTREGNYRPVRETAYTLSQISVYTGVFITAATIFIWFVLFGRAWRKPDPVLFALLVFPMVGTIMQAYFATVMPYDTEGVVKGAYLQFAALPLCVIYGLAVEALWRRKNRAAKALAAVLVLSLVPMTIYTLYARTAALAEGKFASAVVQPSDAHASGARVTVRGWRST